MRYQLAGLLVALCVWNDATWAIAQPPLRVRQSVSRLSPAQVESLRRGVRVMQSRPANDPTSWRFQANIHGTFDPPTDPLFNQCEHGTLHFLTWHRGYIYFFERILRAASGDPQLNLPYWDWSTDRAVPIVFRQPTGAVNPLFHPRQLNNGGLLPTNVVITDRDRALGLIGFSRFSNALDRSPHGPVHTIVGGSGDMSSIFRSANDPIFWVHHGNVDRLWDFWLNLEGGRVNPSDSAFLNKRYTYVDANGQRVTVAVRDMLTSRQLGYRYDNVPNPTPALGPFEVLADAGRPGPASRLHGHGEAAGAQPHEAPGQPHVARKLLATSVPATAPEAAAAPVALKYQPRTLELRLVADAADDLESVGRKDDERILLELYGLKCETAPPFTYAAYLNLPADETNAERRQPYYVGSLNFFGLSAEDRHAKAGHEHAEGPQVLDATETIATLKNAGSWDAGKLSVTLLPLAATPPRGAPENEEARAAGEAAAEKANVSFERIELRAEPAPRAAPQGPQGDLEAVNAPVNDLPRLPRRVALPKPPLPAVELAASAAESLDAASGRDKLEQLIDERRGLTRQLDLLDARIARHAETICGPAIDFQDVERYDGSLGVPRDLIVRCEPSIGQLQWVHDLPDRFAGPHESPGNVNAVRWGSGGMVSPELFLTAGHCFDRDGGGWDMPKRQGQTVSSHEIARLMKVNFKYQVDASTDQLRVAESFPVLELLEYREGELDFALVRLGANSQNELPGNKYGFLKLAGAALPDASATLCLIQHPNGLPKKIHAGPLRAIDGSQISYATLDTLGGSSGSPVLSADGEIVGVHTNGGCTEFSGYNYGVVISAIRRASQISPLTTP